MSPEHTAQPPANVPQAPAPSPNRADQLAGFRWVRTTLAASNIDPTRAVYMYDPDFQKTHQDGDSKSDPVLIFDGTRMAGKLIQSLGLENNMMRNGSTAFWTFPTAQTADLVFKTLEQNQKRCVLGQSLVIMQLC